MDKTTALISCTSRVESQCISCSVVYQIEAVVGIFQYPFDVLNVSTMEIGSVTSIHPLASNAALVHFQPLELTIGIGMRYVLNRYGPKSKGTVAVPPDDDLFALFLARYIIIEIPHFSPCSTNGARPTSIPCSCSRWATNRRHKCQILKSNTFIGFCNRGKLDLSYFDPTIKLFNKLLPLFVCQMQWQRVFLLYSYVGFPGIIFLLQWFRRGCHL